MHFLAARVEQTIERHAWLRPGDPVVVAVSGGLDSMVLLRVLHALADTKSWRLVVAHFDHRLRGTASRADARFVGRAAAALGLEFIHEGGDVAGFARGTGVSVEMAARVLRHRFLAGAARAAKASVIALAHHADDQVELFFVRLFRGAGLEGLAGMDWDGPSPEDRGIRLIRPLLEERREFLEQFAREQRVRYREDASNRNPDMVRNRIRHGLLPLLQRHYQSALASVVLRTMTTLRDAAGYLARETEVWRRARRKSRFGRLPVALQRQIILRQLQELEVTVGFDLIERLRMRAGERVSAGVGRFLSRDEAGKVVQTSGIAFRTEELAIALEGRAGKVRFGELELAWRLVSMRPKARRPGRPRNRTELFDADKIGSRLILRHWRPGDRFQPIGYPRAAKLQDLFVNQRVPRETRSRLVIATTALGEIFWVEGLRIAEGFKLDKATRRGLKWAWQGVEVPTKGLVARCPSPW